MMATYFALLFCSITSVVGISVARKRHSRRVDAHTMRRHVLSFDDVRRNT